MESSKYSALADKSCVPCKGGVPALNAEEMKPLMKALGPNGWNVVEGHHLSKEYKFPDFVQALAFVNRIGAIAESEGHHPDLTLGWGKVGVTTWTHKIDGLTESDFVLAAKIDRALNP